MMGKGGARPGAGAPRRLDGLVKLSVSLDAPTLAKLDLICDRLGLTRSAALRLVLDAMLPPDKTTEEKTNGR